MIHIFKRIIRAPLQAIAVVVLAAVLSASLCGLHAANVREELRFQEMCKTVPITVRVCNLSGTKFDDLGAPGWALKALDSKIFKNTLKNYVKDFRAKMSRNVEELSINGVYYSEKALVGVSNLEISGELSQGNSTMIEWQEGYDASVLGGKDLVCVLPASMVPENYDWSEPLMVDVHCWFQTMSDAIKGVMTGETYRSYRVVGVHHSADTYIYLPFKTVEKLYDALGEPAKIEAMEATLVDNALLEEFRVASREWFAEPNPTGAKTPWRYSYYFSYPFALDIDTDLLDNTERTLRISALINEMCAMLVFVLAVGASFFVGFLMIRSRKREIALMRSLGERPMSIFSSFALEQILCVTLGTAIGGGLFGYEPNLRLRVFLALYTLGLCLALAIFLGRNLMATLKEDE